MSRELSVLSPIDQLGEDIAVLVSRLHAATYELLVLLQQFDQAAGWNNGFLSCAHWLHWRTGIDLGAAREKVRVARALPDLPLLSAAMHRGALSYAKVRALTRVATPANEAQLLDVALTTTAAQVERVVRAWRRCDRVRAAQQADARHLDRGLRTFVDGDGMLVVQGRLTPEQGAIFRKALEAAADQLWRESREAAPADTVVAEVTPAQRRADALVMVAEAALSDGLDAGTAGDRYQVVLHVDAGERRALNEAAGPEPDAMFEQSAVECGDRLVDVSAETSARLACDAAVVVMQENEGGTALDVGRKTRTVPSAIRRALDARDTWCRFPGCSARRCDAHHVVHWAAGGPTRLDNLVLLCRRHHRLLHEGGYTIRAEAGRTFMFINEKGRLVEVAPAAPEWSRIAISTDRTATWLAPLPIEANGRQATAPVWDGTQFDVRHVIDVLRGHEPLKEALGIQ
jgi:hypothetical protein